MKNLGKKETYEPFRLHKYVNVFRLPIVSTAAALYVVCKFLFALSLDSQFVLYILLCILGK